MQLIAADIGNSSTKIAVEHTSDSDRWCMETIFRGDEPLNLDLSAIDVSHEPAFWAVSSVNRDRLKTLKSWVKYHRPNDQFHEIQEEEVSLASDVESRSKLGRDRLIGAWMAVELNDRNGSVITIDAGTAVTIDFVDHDLVFQGGVIFPGAEASFRQLFEYTNALPDLRWANRQQPLGDDHLGVIGKSTTEAILRGVFQSQITAIRGIVAQIAADAKHRPIVYATGGGLADVAQCLPSDWEFVPDLVLRGARTIGRNLMDQR